MATVTALHLHVEPVANYATPPYLSINFLGVPVNAEIISIGSELLLGRTVNSDATLIARVLADLGISLRHIQTVGDNAARISAALELAASRSDLIITTGGLGPTDDDLTRFAIADFAGQTLVPNPEAERALREYFGAREISPNQERQTLFPENAIIFPNNFGTAAGCALRLDSGARIIMLPGPPGELGPMLESSVLPYLAALTRGVIHSTDIRTFGIGEGAAAHMISDLMQGKNPTVAPYASGCEMFVRVTALAEDSSEAEALCAPLAKEIRSRIGDFVYGENVPSLEAAALAALLQQGKTVATAESCTGGLLAKRLTDLPGSSAVFGYGLVTYANEAKEELLRIPEPMLAEFGAVSPQVARAMATNVRLLAGADIGLSITGIAGPDGGSPQKPLGLVYIALAAESGCWHRQMLPQGRYPGRAWIREVAASNALDMLLRHLEGRDLKAEAEI